MDGRHGGGAWTLFFVAQIKISPLKPTNPRLYACLWTLFNIFQWLPWRWSMSIHFCTCVRMCIVQYLHRWVKKSVPSGENICANAQRSHFVAVSATCLRDKIAGIERGIPGHSSLSPRQPRTIKSSQLKNFFTQGRTVSSEKPQIWKYFLCQLWKYWNDDIQNVKYCYQYIHLFFIGQFGTPPLKIRSRCRTNKPFLL